MWCPKFKARVQDQSIHYSYQSREWYFGGAVIHNCPFCGAELKNE